MSFAKKTWVDRVSQYPNRRTINDGYTTKVVTVGRDEGTVSVEGDAFNADNMNDLENRILAACNGGGGGGGFSGDYDDLYNRPQINGVTLTGNKTTADLHISYNDLEDLPVIPVMSAIFNAVYPVGTIYTSVSNTNPGTIFGGTWVAFGSGKTLVGVDSGDSDFNVSEKTGGEKAHTLTVDEMPSHKHEVIPAYGSALSNNSNNHQKLLGASNTGGWATNARDDDPDYSTIITTGGDQAHNNMPPFVCVYFWKRTALAT